MSTIINGQFVFPQQRKTMSVEDAVEYFVLAYSYHHVDIYSSVYDFAQTLVAKCNIDPDYVLNNIGKIINMLNNMPSLEGMRLVSQEIKKHLMPSLIDIDYNELKNKYETMMENKRKKIAVKKAREEYKRLSWFGKLVIKYKYGLPSNDNLSDKTSDEINEMYNVGRQR